MQRVRAAMADDGAALTRSWVAPGGYLQEIAWRYNHRSSRDAFADLLGAACNPQCV